jgi:hypothetical protein
MNVREERMRAIVVKGPGDAATMRVAEVSRRTAASDLAANAAVTANENDQGVEAQRE